MYKYNFVRGLSVPLGQIITEAILKNNLPLPDLVIPIPLHPRRERWRGFNQSELLANHIAENLTPGMSIPVLNNLIIRARYTKPQMKIKNYQERQKNIKDIFSITKYPPLPPGEDAQRAGEDKYINSSSESLSPKFIEEKGLRRFFTIRDKTILLVDDISTTGATLFECGKILKKHGAKKVMGAVIARQEIGFRP
jgi:predicted amidophosphoribosyltransferase